MRPAAISLCSVACVPLALALLSLPSAAGGESSPSYSVVLLDPMPGMPYAAPHAMNDRGRVVGYAALEPFFPISEAVTGTLQGGLTPLPNLDSTFNHALGISENGIVSGSSSFRACTWQDGVMQVLSSGCCFFSGTAWDVSESGLAVGSLGDSDFIGPQHVYWPSATSEPVFLTGITPGNTVGQAMAINRVGQIAGASGGFQGAFFAVRWDTPSSAPLVLGLLPGAFNSEARAINDLGDVVGRSAGETEMQAFFYKSATDELIGLGFLNGENYSEARGLNDRGDVVGTASAAGSEAHAFLWQESTGLMRDLNDMVVLPSSVLYLSNAVAITERGVIAAEAVVGEFGESRIAVLRPLPKHQPSDFYQGLPPQLK